MAYRSFKNQAKEEPQTPPKPEVNYEAEIAAERARREEMEKRLEEKVKAFEEREKERSAYLQQLESSRHNQQTQEQQVQQAIIDLGLSEDDFVGDEKKYQSLKRVQDYLNAIYQENQQTVTRAGQVISGLAEDNHRLQMETLSREPFYKYAKTDIDAYYKANPNTKIPGTPGYESPKTVYEKMVGKNWQSYYDQQAKEKETERQTAPTVGSQYTQTEAPVKPSAPVGPDIHKPKETEVKLHPAEQEMLEYFRLHEPGLFKGGAAEWRAIQSGKVLPKTTDGAMDWQRGWRPEDYKESTSTED